MMRKFSEVVFSAITVLFLISGCEGRVEEQMKNSDFSGENPPITGTQNV